MPLLIKVIHWEMESPTGLNVPWISGSTIPKPNLVGYLEIDRKLSFKFAIKVIFPVLDGTNLILSWIKIHQQKDAGQLWSVTIALEMKFLFPDSVSMIVLHLVSCGLVIGLVWWPFISCTFWARLIVFHNWFLLSVYIFSLFGLFVGTVNKCWMCATLVNLTYIYVLSLWILY